LPSPDTSASTRGGAEDVPAASRLSLEERRTLALNLDDPLNRWYRYPAAHGLLRVIGGLPLRPDHITYIHTLFGILSAVLVATGSRAALLAAFVALEIRDVLDCYDGVLARAKKMSSPRGRTLDEISDAVSFIALSIGLIVYGVRFDKRLPLELFVAMGIVIVLVGAFTAHGCDFYKRRLGSALREGKDAIAAELEVKLEAARQGNPSAITRFGIFFDRWQLVFYEPKYRTGTPLATVLARAHRPGLRLFVRFVGLMSWEMGIFVIHVGLLTGYVVESWALAGLYGLTVLFVGRVLATLTLGGTVPGETPANEATQP